MAEDSISEAAFVVFYLFILFSVLALQGGIALFYTGLTSSKAALTQLSYCVAAHVVGLLQFFSFGYTLIVSENHGFLSFLVGGLRHFMLRNISWSDSQGMIEMLGSGFIHFGFAGVCSNIMFGAVNLRARMVASLVFQFLWLCVVYSPAAYWAWNDAGWARRWGVLDYAGGTVVHCVAGFTALIYSRRLGVRIGYENYNMQPFNLMLVVIGTFAMIMGWVGFNGGATMAPNTRVLLAITNTAISAASGGLAWLLLDHSFDGEWSLVGLCSGVVSGLVCITSGAGFVDPIYACVFGVVGGIVCNLSTQLKFRLGIDDALDVFAVHGMGGLAGTVLTGIFASPQLTENYGLIYGSPVQLFKQLFHVTVLTGYVMVMSCGLLTVVQSGFGLQLRVSPDEERAGLDLAEHGETALFNASEPLAGSNPGLIQHDATMSRYTKTNTNTSMIPTADTPLLERSREYSHA